MKRNSENIDDDDTESAMKVRVAKDGHELSVVPHEPETTSVLMYLRSRFPRVTLIDPFVLTSVIFHGSFCLGLFLLCGVYRLSVSILYHQLRNHNQFIFHSHGLYLISLELPIVSYSFQSAMKGILNNISRPNTTAPGEA